MNPQDLQLFKEQYAQMRLDNRPQPMCELLTEHPTIDRERVWPQWLLNEEHGIGEFEVGGSRQKRNRLERFHATWRRFINTSKHVKGWGYKVRCNGKEYWFTPQSNRMYQWLGRRSNDGTVIQPAIHLLIGNMELPELEETLFSRNGNWQAQIDLSQPIHR